MAVAGSRISEDWKSSSPTMLLMVKYIDLLHLPVDFQISQFSSTK